MKEKEPSYCNTKNVKLREINIIIDHQDMSFVIPRLILWGPKVNDEINSLVAQGT